MFMGWRYASYATKIVMHMKYFCPKTVVTVGSRQELR